MDNNKNYNTVMKRGVDLESNLNNDYKPFEEPYVRHAFLRKIFFIVGLAFTACMVAVFVLTERAKILVYENRWILWMALGVMLTIMVVMAWCTSIRRKAPNNYICLSVFTAAGSVLVGVISCYFEPIQVLLAVGITALLVNGLALFAMQTRVDFTVFTGILYIFLLLLVTFAFVVIFGRIPILRLVYSALAVFIFSVLLVIDIQLMMGGYHKYTISPEEYIFAALNIYIDVILILINVLQLADFF